MFRATLNTSIFQNITQLVRILPPLPTWVGTKPGHAKPQCFDDLRDSKNDSIFGARREIQRRDPPCTELHGRYRRSKELAKNAKKPGKTRVLQRRGQEPNNPQIPWETHTSTPGATRNTTRADFIV